MTTNKFAPLEWIDRGIQTLAFVGVTKNTGKTTALNAVARIIRKDYPEIGLISSGLDGEARDYLMEIEKPAVFVDIGDKVVTATRAIEKSSAGIERIESLEFESPLGEVVYARVISPGDVVLAGIRHRADLQEGLSKFGKYPILVDGACGRLANADAHLVDGVVVSTGGIVSNDIGEIVEQTQSLCQTLSNESPKAAWHQTLIAEAVSSARPMLGKEGDSYTCSTTSALVGFDELKSNWEANPSYTAIAIPGVITNSIGNRLLNLSSKNREATLLIRDGTSLQMDSKLEGKIRKKWDVYVQKSVPLLEITVNPKTFSDHSVETKKLKAEIKKQIPGVPVIDILNDLKSVSQSSAEPNDG